MSETQFKWFMGAFILVFYVLVPLFALSDSPFSLRPPHPTTLKGEE